MVNVGVTPCHKTSDSPTVTGDGWGWFMALGLPQYVMYISDYICILSYMYIILHNIIYIYIILYVYNLICVAYVYIYMQYVAHMYQYIISGTTMYISVLLFPCCIYIYIVHVCVGLYVCLVLPVRIRTNNFALKKKTR